MIVRRAVIVTGVVQGVGFRPFVHTAASELGLGGFVRNESGAVHIEIEGEERRLDDLVRRLRASPPPLARVESIHVEACEARGEREFRIDHSVSTSAERVFHSADIATCSACLAELFDPSNRRYRYPFLNCTNCGPRFSIAMSSPYDRERTTMAGFTMCRPCQQEYDDPRNRRFHAQPTACAACGPRARWLDAAGNDLAVADPVTACAEAIARGQIVAIKGLAGFHLACDAESDTAVALLRHRKAREEKPLALMVKDLAAAEALAHLSDVERQHLLSASRPIVLVRRRERARVASWVSPRTPLLGLMLPYTPLHHLLLDALGGRPLVMTSGNRSDEPIAFRDDDAREKLAGIADHYLVHDRPIHIRSDDSVRRVVDGTAIPHRRSRGEAPMPLSLPVALGRPALAAGAHTDVTFALGAGAHAFVSHHLGDLDDYEAYRAYVEGIDHYERLFGIEPRLLVHDLHPDYASSRHARERAAASGVALLGVQHHHAHMASCMAEHGLIAPVIAVAFDGAGHGLDGAVWGGEFLVGDLRAARRAAHLRYVPLPGGDRAVREPWRMAVAHLVDAGVGLDLVAKRREARAVDDVQRLLGSPSTPRTSSAGRLFDAVAAIAGVRDLASYEGQAAIELEAVSTDREAGVFCPPAAVFDAEGGSPFIADTRPLVRSVAHDIAAGADVGIVGARFHRALAALIAAVCTRIRGDTMLSSVVLTGGVFQNAVLTHETSKTLSSLDFRVYRHRRVPPGDGGIGLGQLAIAAAVESTSPTTAG